MNRLSDYYHKRMEINNHELPPPLLEARRDLERETRLQALKAERTEYYKLRSRHHINDSTLQKLVREVDLIETALTASATRQHH